MTTHDPLVFSRLKRSQVRIFRRKADGNAVADEPLNDPQGMGIQAILASDLFRLPSAGLDSMTEADLALQRRLASQESLSGDEEAELRAVTERLDALGFWKSDRDPIYQLFLQEFLPKWLKREKAEWSESVDLTVDQMRERQALASEIAREVADERASKDSPT